MRRISTIIFSILIFLLLLVIPVLAQDSHTAREEREGKAIWDKLQKKQLTCDRLSDEEFERLGEYYMGQMMGDSHEAMNNMMAKMMGEKGEEQMHLIMGKRLSGCDSSAQLTSQGVGFMPMLGMMQMMTGGDRSMMGYGGFNNMMGGFGLFGLLFWLFWIVILVDLILLGIWLWKKIKKEK
ncbi:hypothetical protein HY612_04610 [Candidatus Roizmanbacteria bacterium]|nr:hypothetical protein [Candidatus Roizmanbacteria bacterium]